MIDGSVVKDLAGNLLVTLFFMGLWAYYASEVTALRRGWRAVVAGLFMGIASSLSIFYSIPISDGIVIDMRLVPVAVAGLFGGPVAALVALPMPTLARLYIGGSGMPMGVLALVLSACVGAVAHVAAKGRTSGSVTIPFSAALAIVPVLPMFMLGFAGRGIWLVASFNFAGALVSVATIGRGMKRADRDRLYRMAISVVPDYFYIKDSASRLVAYNNAVANVHSASRNGLVGKSDLDLEIGARGRRLFDEEQELFRTGSSLNGVIEVVAAADGLERTFKTSKTIVTDADGHAVGLVGITRDVTEEGRQQREVRETAERLSRVLSQMADGVALFDHECRLIFCNEQYHAMFSLTRDVRLPGVPLSEVLRAAVARGEQQIASDDIDEWIDGVMSGIKGGLDEEVLMGDGRHLAVRNRPVAGLGFVSVVSDVTEFRRNETQLAVLTRKLQILATTDDLTGLINRRLFDELFEREMARSIRNETPISVLMIDVDNFKAYNDIYGHQAGDRCLRIVGRTLKTTVGRATDIVARYGGEEFCIVLPDTDEAGATLIASHLRQAILSANVPHEGSPVGRVSFSIGVASFHDAGGETTCAALLSRADEALYDAKRTGRNRVCAWARDTRQARAG